jgi:hypothetical protein
MINIQQTANRLIVLPQDFYIREPNKALVSFGKNGDNNNKKVSIAEGSIIIGGSLVFHLIYGASAGFISGRMAEFGIFVKVRNSK